VTLLRDGVTDDDCLSRFDWYAATLLADSRTITEHLVKTSLLLTPQGHGRFGYSEVYEGILPGGTSYTLLTGGNRGAPPNVYGSGGNAPEVGAMLRTLTWRHRVTRADSALDFEGSGVWETLTGYLVEFAHERGLDIANAGDWISDAAPRGRTLYVGSRKSKAFLRCYEKGKQLGDADSKWVRVELVIRPEGEQRDKAAFVSPDDLWGFAGWPSELAPWLMGGLVPGRVTASRRHSTDPLHTRLIALFKRNNRLLSQGITKYGAKKLMHLLETTLEDAQ